MGLFDLLKRKGNEPPKQVQQEQIELAPNEIQLQFVSLLFEREPQLDKQKICAELDKLFEQVDSPEGDSPMAFFFPDFMVELKDASIPAQAAIIKIDKKVDPNRFKTALQQSWHWEEAEAVLGLCKYEVTLTDLMSRSLTHQARLEFFQRFIIGVIRATHPSAVHFRNSDKLLDAQEYLSSVTIEQPAFLGGALNVRMFNISGPDNEVLMDTLGLSAYGLADFECRFSGYDPGEIAGVLTNIAYYVFKSGDQIRSNSTVQGIGKKPIWKTNYSESKVEPSRLVVEVLPN